MKRSLSERIATFLKKKPAPEGLCPNCWGRQEYAGGFYEAMKNERVNINEAPKKLGWIADYADKNLQKIELVKKGDQLECPVCKVTYTKGEIHND